MNMTVTRPACFNARQLRRVGIEIEKTDVGEVLRCVACGHGWMLLGKRRRRGYWKCPDGCNAC